MNSVQITLTFKTNKWKYIHVWLQEIRWIYFILYNC